VYRFSGVGYDRAVTSLAGNRLRLRPLAVGLLAVGAAVILGSTWLLYTGLPIPRGTTPYTELGLSGSLRDLTLFAGLWSLFGLVFGGWKVVLVAIGRSSGHTLWALGWFGVFAAYLVWLAMTTINHYGFHLWS
jgi:hypothetical protein